MPTFSLSCAYFTPTLRSSRKMPTLRRLRALHLRSGSPVYLVAGAPIVLQRSAEKWKETDLENLPEIATITIFSIN